MILEILDISLRVICFVVLIIVVGFVGQLIGCFEIDRRHQRWDKRREAWLRGKHDRMFPDDDKERKRINDMENRATLQKAKQ